MYSSQSINSYVPYTYRTRSFPNGYGLSSSSHNSSSPSSRFYRSESAGRRLPALPTDPFRRSISVAPSATITPPTYYNSYRKALSPVRTMIRESFSGDSSDRKRNTSLRSRAPSLPRERTRDELIDSIIHTRTRENRVMPGYLDVTDWEERRSINVDCDTVYPGIILANGDTLKNIDYIKSIGVTHVLNTAERHVVVNPNKYSLHGITYYGFHVDDHPSANISRHFGRTTDYIHEALTAGGTVLVNCVMGWSRSATIVVAYLMSKKGLSSSTALELLRQYRPIRPNPGFLQQLADHENLMNKKPYW
ncbi:dual specificity phosphatase 29 [Lepeophtheirus salmonis]|uniref:dual specificity phosphatase 29 n=1 Tax=Lepeophtheirus salmonis TaxID=72036 RepID=UPI001AEA0BD8|nr:dual specificity phosphatase 29-like [Lepeophtheirus salmonis]